MGFKPMTFRTFFFPDISYYSDPDGIQTHDLQNRNLTLYSAKLRGHNK